MNISKITVNPANQYYYNQQQKKQLGLNNNLAVSNRAMTETLKAKTMTNVSFKAINMDMVARLIGLYNKISSTSTPTKTSNNSR